ncbi:uncharacterized protein [Physcomitrium patens]|uniref:uncharacterized protein n=1 Tax=Physcomitrium patens TaxID=3218 RepID=UPI003CCD4443
MGYLCPGRTPFTRRRTPPAHGCRTVDGPEDASDMAQTPPNPTPCEAKEERSQQQHYQQQQQQPLLLRAVCSRKPAPISRLSCGERARDIGVLAMMDRSHIFLLSIMDGNHKSPSLLASRVSLATWAYVRGCGGNSSLVRHFHTGLFV